MGATAAEWMSWRRVAVAGLVALLAAMLLGSWLPDPAQLAPADLADLAARSPRTLALARRLPAARLLTSPWLMVIPVVLGIAIASNVLDRVRRQRRARPAPAAARFRPQLEWEVAQPADVAAGTVRDRLSRRGYRVEAGADPDGARHVVGRRGAIGFWGSIAFHVGLVLALVAVAISVVGASRGEARLVEGDQVSLDAPGAVRVDAHGALAPALPHTLLELRRCDATYQDDRFPLEYRAELTVVERSGALREVAIRVNEPVTVDGQQLLLRSFDVAPVLTIERGATRVLQGPVPLSIRRGHEDDFEVPQSLDRIFVRWFGDVVRDGTRTSSRSDLPRNPALGLRWERQGVLQPETVLVRRGEAARLGPYRVAFRDARYWIDLGVEQDPGAPVLLFAVAVASLGLALRFWDHEREIRVRLVPAERGAHIAAQARSRYFPALIARELDDLKALS